MKNYMLAIKSDQHEYFELAVYNKVVSKSKFHVPVGTMADKLILHFIDFLKVNHIDVDDIKKIIVYSGPGSYTSLRIGIAFANTFALVKDIPIYTYIGDKDICSVFEEVATSPEIHFSKPVDAYYQQPIE